MTCVCGHGHDAHRGGDAECCAYSYGFSDNACGCSLFEVDDGTDGATDFLSLVVHGSGPGDWIRI